MKILVVDGANRSALAIVRTLGRKGHHVVVGEEFHPCLASVSRYCSDRFTYPSPKSNEDAFIGSLMNAIRSKGIRVVLPVTDITTLLISKQKKVVEEYCRVPFAAYDTLECARDKIRICGIAESLGIPVPETVVLERREDIDAVPDNIIPCAVKAGKSRVQSRSGWVSRATEYADDREELSQILSEKGKDDFPLIIQRRVNGPGVGVFYCYSAGKPVARFAHRRIREKPPSGGVSVLRESITLSSELKEYSDALLNYLNWQGVAMVEYKIDSEGGVPMLMEINGRFWGSLQLAIDAGVDFPNILIDSANNGETVAVETYKVGVKTRWLMGDIDSLLMVLFKNRKNLAMSDAKFSRLSYLFSFLKPGGPLQHLEVLTAEDPRPGIHEIKHWFRQMKR